MSRILSLYFLLAVMGCSSTTKPESSSPAAASSASFQVSKEKYQTSLKEIRDFTQKLNQIIQNQDFLRWTSYLDRAYIQAYSDPMRLKVLSENSPVLKQYNVRMKNLEDYFRYVVVPSRSNATADDISFVDEERVEAWMKLKGEKALLYQLKLHGKEWKISSW